MARRAQALMLGLFTVACGRATLDPLELEDVSTQGGTAGTAGSSGAGSGGANSGGRGGTAGSAGSGGSAAAPIEWQAPIAIGNELNYGYAPAVAIDQEGNAFVAWRENSPTYQIWACRYSAATKTWGLSEVIPFTSGFVNFVTAGFGHTGVPQVALWLGDTGIELGSYDIVSSTWQVTNIPVPQGNGALGVPAIAGTGRIAALWGENSNLGGDPTALWTARYTPLAGWSEHERLLVSGVDRFGSSWIDASPNDYAAAI